MPDPFRICCKALTKDGQPCKAPPTEGGLCYFHANPGRVRQLGQIGGRKNRRRTIDPSEFAPVNPGGVRQMLAQTIVDLKEKAVEMAEAS